MLPGEMKDHKNGYVKKKKTINMQTNTIHNRNTLFTEKMSLWYHVLKYIRYFFAVSKYFL